MPFVSQKEKDLLAKCFDKDPENFTDFNSYFEAKTNKDIECMQIDEYNEDDINLEYFLGSPEELWEANHATKSDSNINKKIGFPSKTLEKKDNSKKCFMSIIFDLQSLYKKNGQFDDDLYMKNLKEFINLNPDCTKGLYAAIDNLAMLKVDNSESKLKKYLEDLINVNGSISISESIDKLLTYDLINMNVLEKINFVKDIENTYNLLNEIQPELINTISTNINFLGLNKNVIEKYFSVLKQFLNKYADLKSTLNNIISNGLIDFSKIVGCSLQNNEFKREQRRSFLFFNLEICFDAIAGIDTVAGVDFDSANELLEKLGYYIKNGTPDVTRYDKKNFSLIKNANNMNDAIFPFAKGLLEINAKRSELRDDIINTTRPTIKKYLSPPTNNPRKVAFLTFAVVCVKMILLHNIDEYEDEENRLNKEIALKVVEKIKANFNPPYDENLGDENEDY